MPAEEEVAAAGARLCWGSRSQEPVQAERLAVSAASAGGWCVLATSVTFCSEGPRWGGHRKLQNGTESARFASWRSGDAVRADLEVGGGQRRPDSAADLLEESQRPPEPENEVGRRQDRCWNGAPMP